MANEAYRGGQKGLQAVASAIEALRCDFVAKDDIREAGLEELNGKVDALDQFWMDLQIFKMVIMLNYHQRSCFVRA